MKRAISVLVVLAVGFSLALTSCAPQQADYAVIGPYPADYKEIVQRHILRTYFDPYSIRSARIAPPQTGHMFFQQGWIVCSEFNAKNRMGGYTGLKHVAFLINRGTVVQTASEMLACKDVVPSYVPWPEIENLR